MQLGGASLKDSGNAAGSEAAMASMEDLVMRGMLVSKNTGHGASVSNGGEMGSSASSTGGSLGRCIPAHGFDYEGAQA